MEGGVERPVGLAAGRGVRPTSWPAGRGLQARPAAGVLHLATAWTPGPAHLLHEGAAFLLVGKCENSAPHPHIPCPYRRAPRKRDQSWEERRLGPRSYLQGGVFRTFWYSSSRKAVGGVGSTGFGGLFPICCLFVGLGSGGPFLVMWGRTFIFQRGAEPISCPPKDFKLLLP